MFHIADMKWDVFVIKNKNVRTLNYHKSSEIKFF